MRHDSEGSQVPGPGCGLGRAHGALERRHIADHVIGREHQQQGVLFPPCQRRVRRQRDGRGRIAAHGFQHDGLRSAFDGAQLFGHQEAMRFVAHHHRWGYLQAVQPSHRVLKHGVRTGQGQKLLRV